MANSHFSPLPQYLLDTRPKIDVHRALDHAKLTREREAALCAVLLAGGFDDFRVDKLNAALADIDNDDAAQQTDPRCSKADAVIVYAYGPAADVWWRGIEGKLARLDKLSVWRIPAAAAQTLATLAERSMSLQATVHESVLTLSATHTAVSLEPLRWK